MSGDQIAPGTVIGNDFRVERFLKGGGMGDVYIARQLSTAKARALKVMQAHLTREPKMQERFKQEAQLGGSINSSHVVDVIASGIDERSQRPWLVMELLDGDDLKRYIERRGPMSPREVVLLFEQLCRALAAAHAANIVHRDIKPENIFLVTSPQSGVPFLVKVLDFGIAKVVADFKAENSGTTQLGTPLWMAPEQMETTGDLTPAADIWPLGLIAFWALTGVHYWKTGNQLPISPLSVTREIVAEEIVPASRRARELGVDGLLPPGFDAWFARCVERNSKKRESSATQVYTELLALFPGVTAGGSGVVTGPGLRPVPSNPFPRWLGRAAAAVITITLLITGIWALSRYWGKRACHVNEPVKGGSLERGLACLRACGDGTTEYCVAAGEILLEQTPPTELTAREAKRALKSACDAKNLRGCSLLAQIHEKDDERARALDLYLLTCDEGTAYVEDCVAAGRLLQSPDWPRSDLKHARRLFKKACGPKAISGCLLLGRALQRDPDKDEAQAVSAFKSACDGKNGEGCFEQGKALSEGKGVPKDAAKAAEALKRGCALDHSPACNRLPEPPPGKPITPTQTPTPPGGGTTTPKPSCAGVVEKLEKACQQGNDGAACNRLGQMYEKGKCTRSNKCMAHSFYNQGCRLHKDLGACQSDKKFHLSYGSICGE